MRKLHLCFILALLLALTTAMPAWAEPQAPAASAPSGTATPRDWSQYAPDGELLPSKITAESAILMDAQSGKILFQKDADKQQFPASITKIMTCLVALDSGKNLTDIVTVGALPALESGAEKYGLKAGEQLTLEELLYGLMLESYNDMANAIAQFVGDGSIDKFIEMMNNKAKEIGMTNTHYMNPNGLHDPQHYTSAHDMAILTREAFKYPEFVKLISTVNYTMHATNKHNASQKWQNHNKLILPIKGNTYYYKYATGVKTGFTSAAQSTLVSSAQKGNLHLIAVVMRDGALPKWTDSVTMFEYGFNFYDTVDLKDQLASQTLTVDIKNAAADDSGQGKLNVALSAQSAAYITDRKDVISQLKDDPTKFQQSITLTKDTAPIKKDDTVGTVTFTYQDQPVLTCDLIATRDINELENAGASASDPAASAGSATNGASAKPGSTKAPQNAKGSTLGTALLWVGIVILVLLAAMLAIRLVNMQRRSRKYRQYNYRSSGNSARFRR